MFKYVSINNQTVLEIYLKASNVLLHNFCLSETKAKYLLLY